MKTITHFGCVASLIICNAAHADNHNWNGLGASDNWSSVTNWSSGGAPIANETTPVTLVFPSGGFRPSNICNIANLTMESIVINGSGYTLTGSQPITLIGSGNSLYSSGTNNLITIPLVLGSANLNFGQANGSTLRTYNVISGSGGFEKIGRGDLYLEGANDNTFTGTTTVLGGMLHLKKQGTRAAFSGPLVIGDTAGSSVGGGVDSTVVMDGEQQMPFNTAVTVNPDAEFDMKDHSAAIGSLTMVGNGQLDSTGTSGSLTVFGNIICTNPTNDYAFASVRPNLSLGGATRTITTDTYVSYLSCYGTISSGGGNAGIIKNGDGTLHFSGNSSYTGDTIINQGRFSIYGISPASNIYLKPGTSLYGAATVGAVQCLGAIFEPDVFDSSNPVNLTTKSLSIDKASTFVATLDYLMVGTQSLLTVLGTVNLGGCELERELQVTDTYNPPTGTKFRLINNDLADPIVGTFNELPEGTSFKFSGRRWNISYKGGDGNDVVLTLTSGQLPLSLDNIALGSGGNWTVLTGNGTPGVTYRMESSPDLKVWTDEGSVGNSYGNLTAYANDYSSHKRYFYRFLLPLTNQVPK